MGKSGMTSGFGSSSSTDKGLGWSLGEFGSQGEDLAWVSVRLEGPLAGLDLFGLDWTPGVGLTCVPGDIRLGISGRGSPVFGTDWTLEPNLCACIRPMASKLTCIFGETGLHVQSYYVSGRDWAPGKSLAYLFVSDWVFRASRGLCNLLYTTSSGAPYIQILTGGLSQESRRRGQRN